MAPLKTMPRPSIGSNIGWAEPCDRSMILSRRCPNPMRSWTNRPLASGPRGAWIEVMRASASTSTEPPSKRISPARPHMRGQPPFSWMSGRQGNSLGPRTRPVGPPAPGAASDARADRGTGTSAKWLARTRQVAAARHGHQRDWKEAGGSWRARNQALSSLATRCCDADTRSWTNGWEAVDFNSPGAPRQVRACARPAQRPATASAACPSPARAPAWPVAAS